MKTPLHPHVRSPALTVLLAVMACASRPAFSEIELRMGIEREVSVSAADGSLVLRREPATQLRDGDTVILTIHYVNTEDSVADRVTIEHPVPARTLYQPRGAGGNRARPLVSTDGGQTYVEEEGINPTRVTDIRWIVEDVPGHGEGTVFVRLRVFKGATGAP